MESIDKTIINEISVGPFIKGIFGGIKNLFRGASDDVAKYASAEMGKVVQRLSKSGAKNISLQTLRSSAEYKKSLSALGEDYALKTFKKSYKSLTDAEKKIVVTETTKNLDNVITKELQLTVGKIGSEVADGLLKGVKLVRSGQKTAQMTKVINSLNKTTKASAQKLIKSNVKLIGDGTKGVNIVDKIKSGQITIIKNGQFYTTQTKNLANQPVKVFQLNRKTLLTLGSIGVVGAAAAYLIADEFKNDAVVLVDENGKDVTEEQLSQWAECVQELLKSKEAVLGTTPEGIVRVILKNTEYPSGIAFYTNGRVVNLSTKEMGNWKCKSGKPAISESKKMSFMSLLNEEVGLKNVDITWDSGKKTDDGKVTPPVQSKYHDCSKKDVNKEPLEIFCKSQQIKDIQRCLKFPLKYQTGNFGPITMKALGNVQSITKEIYDKVTSNCEQSTTTDTGSQNTRKPISTIDMDKKDLSLSNQIDTKNIKIPNLSNVQSPEGLYNALVNGGAISSLTDTEGNMRRRIVYKGPDLTDDQLSSLKSYLISKGYDDRFSQVDHRKGEKYVFVNRG